MRYEKLADFMHLGKFDETTKKLQYSVISERELFAALLSLVRSPRLDRYIEVRSGKSLVALWNYKAIVEIDGVSLYACRHQFSGRVHLYRGRDLRSGALHYGPKVKR